MTSIHNRNVRGVLAFFLALALCVPLAPTHAQVTDVCINIDGYQETIPPGFELDNEICVEVDILDVIDVCVNLPDIQENVPDGYEVDGEVCIEVDVPDIDICENIPDIQVTVPDGYYEVNGNCSQEPPSEEEQCEADGGIWDPITETCNDDPTPQEECEADGGTWNGEECLPDDDDTPQEECEAGGGTWNEDTETCTPPSEDDCDPGFHLDNDVCVPDEDDNDSGGGGGGGGRNRNMGGGGGNDDDGEVLGAATCDALLSTYIGPTWSNDSTEVAELQAFLNDELGTTLLVTGIYDAATLIAVHAFQRLHWEEVLVPWYGIPNSGIYDSDDSTGYVYKTTQRMINNIYCPDLDLPIPQLP